MMSNKPACTIRYRGAKYVLAEPHEGMLRALLEHAQAMVRDGLLEDLRDGILALDPSDPQIADMISDQTTDLNTLVTMLHRARAAAKSP